MKRRSHLRFYTNLFLTSALAIGGSFAIAKSALAIGTPAGTTITNTATGSFDGATSGTTGTVTSNAVNLSVLEVAGITLVSSGTTEPTTTVGNGLTNIWASLTPGPYQGVEGVNKGDIVYFDFTITNTGNSPTAFFIPDIATVTGGIQRGIRVIEVDPDGGGPATATTMSVNVPTNGALTTAAGFLPTPATDGYIPIGGTVKVRVAVEITGFNIGDTTTVVLGNTVAVGDQNQDYVASTGPANRDVFTSDLTDGTPVPTTGYLGVGYSGVANIDQTVETAGLPVNGDAITHRKEASASNATSILASGTIDYGDAPNTFKTLLNSATGYSGSGASHIIDPTIKMGLLAPDAEADGQPSANADGDNILGTNDEDGVTLPTLLTSATTYSATVNVTNTSGSPVYLVGWIDFNKGGTFDASEAQVYDQASNTSTAIPTTNGVITITPIPTGTNGVNKTLTWTGISGLNPGDVLYARFRLTTDIRVIGSTTTVASIVPQPQTPLSKGEVEDYKITVGAATPNLNAVKRITSIAGVDITTFNSSTSNPTSNDADAKWPSPAATYLRGGVDCTAGGSTCNGVKGGKPGDVVEYTIYFLANGNDNLKNVKICDAIPTNTTYVPGSIVLGWDSAGTNLPDPSAAIGPGETALTDAADGDIGRFLSIGTIDAVNAPTGSVCQTGANPTGAIFVNFGATPVIPFATGSATPKSSYGFIRFKVTVN